MLLFQGFTFPNAMCRSKALGKGRPKPTSRRNREKRVTLHTYGQTANADTAPLATSGPTWAGPWVDTFKSASAVGLLLFCGVAAGCQADSNGFASSSKNNDIKPPPSTTVEESFGESGSEITLLVPKGASGMYEGAARDIRDGAALGVGELGGGQVRVKVVDVATGAAGVPAAVSAAKARNAAVLVSYAPPNVTAAIAAIPADQRPPLLNLGTPVATNVGSVFNFTSDEIDSAVDGLKAAAAAGHKKVLAFAPEDLSPADEARLGDTVRQAGGTFGGVVRYGLNDAAAADAVKKAKSQLAAADTVLILGKTPAVTTIAEAIKAGGQSNVTFVGTSAWPARTYSNPAVAGTLIAAIEPEGTTLIAERYKRHYNRPLTSDAAYGYDSVAITAGIVRTKGPEALTTDNLTNKLGFKGTTGLFRLTPSGTVDRKMSLYAIEGGKLTLRGTAAQAF